MRSPAKTPRRLLFVTPCGRLDPAGHKRVYDLLPLFGERGYETKTISHRWEALWRARSESDAGHGGYRRLLWALNASGVAPAVIRRRDERARARFARLVRWADATVVLQTSLDAEWRRILREHSRRVLYDFDDAVWLTDAAGFAAMMALADTAVAGNGFLAERARREHRDVRVIPTSVRLDRYEAAPRRAPRDPHRCTVGWVGSPSTARYLARLSKPLAELGAELPVSLEIVGSGGVPLPEFPGVRLRLHPHIPYDPVRFVPGFDIGVMPLDDTEWERGKCGAKALEYMAAAVPAVCSDVGESRRLVEDGVSGFLVRSPEEWVSVLGRLARDRELGLRVGRAGRERVREAYSANMAASLWRDCLNE